MSMQLSDSGFYGIIDAMRVTSMAARTTAVRLATGHRINSGADDPSGVIALSILNSQMGAVQAASDNASRVSSMMSTADGAMEEISSLVSDIQGSVVSLANDTGLSADEKQALQAGIDSSIASIDRLVNTTTFNGQHLLNGQLAIGTTGVDATRITDMNVTGKSTLGNATMQVKVVSAADKAQVAWTGASLGWGNPVTLKITGESGSVNLNFAAGSTTAQMATTINANTATTGVHGSASGGKLYFVSDHTGKDEFVQVQTISGTFNLDGGVSQDYGKNAVVTVNGQTASMNDLAASFGAGGTSGTMNLSETFATTAGGTTTFTVTDGGATFAITPDAGNVYTLGISDMSSSRLGNATLGYLNSLATGGANCAKDHAAQAVQIANAASLQVAATRGNIGGFQKYTVGSMQNMLARYSTSLADSISQVGDTDYAMETANMTRLNSLFQAQSSALAMTGQNMSSFVSILLGMGGF